MATILTFIEVRDGQIKKASLEALSEAVRLGGAHGMGASAVLVGDNLAALKDVPGQYGASVVYTVEHSDLRLYSPEGYTTAIVEAVRAESPAALFFSSTAMGKDLSGRVAARLSTAVANDCTEVSFAGTFKVRRPMYAGKTFATVSFTEGSFPVISLRPNIFRAEEKAGQAEQKALSPSDLGIRSRAVALEKPESAELDVTEARVIVSGGRAMKGPENFPMLRELAQLLGGALGASRAAVDAGWIDHKYQVGQTGKTVSPDLYIACGISGAIQHLAGMSSSKVIVAINKDAEAPIFGVADYGIVGDLYQIVPELVKEVKNL
ncbi:MAG TPA: electron transfer flavoprotein subunit alpha/FixB family protein [Thermoanaerobaculia bacterium]|nr:electron transfer flavoprotein subunit alpha/FixB family protein [Thermoanaerobaculia bacterium]HUM30004.1 electron transfer flavoprotein subunit alpha/FixB family protein [Thermoanaerobaculia bacterium]HXK68307.1 electron transfer flavoprotein subunit alpha/FixB family protein [Thermoanaerobaculia bacterium]